MQEFAFRQKIERFERLLKFENDLQRRAVLTNLLDAERAKLAALSSANGFGRLHTQTPRREVDRNQGG